MTNPTQDTYITYDPGCALCRYVQSSQTDLPGPANAELRLREERLSRRVCSACCRPFSLLTNRWDIYTYLHYLHSISQYPQEAALLQLPARSVPSLCLFPAPGPGVGVQTLLRRQVRVR